MAHFQRIRLFGLWTTGSALQPGEMELFDANLSKAINGDEGGPWAPTSPIELGGAGIKITGPAEFTGEFKVATEALLQGGATITGGPLAVSTNANVQGNLTVDGNASMGGNLSVDGSASVVGNLSVEGIAVLQDDVGIDGTLTVAGGTGLGGAPEGGFAAKVTGNCKVTGTCSIGSNLTVDGAVTLNAATLVANDLGVTGTLTVNGKFKGHGRFKRDIFTMVDAGGTISPADYQMIYLADGVLTADRTIILDTATAEAGDAIRVIVDEDTKFLEIDHALDTLTMRRATGQVYIAEFTFFGGTWRVTDRVFLPLDQLQILLVGEHDPSQHVSPAPEQSSPLCLHAGAPASPPPPPLPPAPPMPQGSQVPYPLPSALQTCAPFVVLPGQAHSICWPGAQAFGSGSSLEEQASRAARSRGQRRMQRKVRMGTMWGKRQRW